MEPTLEEIDRMIHKWLGKCCHENKRPHIHNGYTCGFECSDCDMMMLEREFEIPSYHTDLNLCAEMEKRILDVKTEHLYSYYTELVRRANDFAWNASAEIRVRAWYDAVGKNLEDARK